MSRCMTFVDPLLCETMIAANSTETVRYVLGDINFALDGAPVAELADAADSKSVARKGVGVRVSPGAPAVR